MQALTLRQAGLDDLDRIMTLEAAGFAAGNRESRRTYAERISAFPGGSLLACLGEQTVGCAFTEIWPATPLPPADHFNLGHDIRERHDPRHGTELYISSMTLAPEYRGRGLGATLLNRLLGRLAADHPGLTTALLLVNETWTGARRLYAAAGFAEIGRLGAFFVPEPDRREDGILMRRTIGDYR